MLRPRPEMDITAPEVQARLLVLARDARDPNMWTLSPPCPSFWDWQQHNGGTRTFARLLGGGVAPLTPTEVAGYAIARFLAEVFTVLRAQGKGPLVEQPASTERYPELWDFPSRLAQRADCFAVTFRFCLWGLQEVQGGGFYATPRSSSTAPPQSPTGSAVRAPSAARATGTGRSKAGARARRVPIAPKRAATRDGRVALFRAHVQPAGHRVGGVWRRLARQQAGPLRGIATSQRAGRAVRLAPARGPPTSRSRVPAGSRRTRGRGQPRRRQKRRP